MSSEVVLVSRKWSNPEILVGISNDGISIQMGMNEFVEALVTEVGSPAMLFSSDALRQKITAAAQKIQTEMQASTAQAMAHHLGN